MPIIILSYSEKNLFPPFFFLIETIFPPFIPGDVSAKRHKNYIFHMIYNLFSKEKTFFSKI